MPSGAGPWQGTMRPAPPRRADARRNHERLLEVARELFEERGAGVPLDEIARRAGAGNASMYRHFPTRRDMIVAVYADEVERLCAKGRDLLDAEAPWDALFTWLRGFVEHVAGKRELILAIPEDRDGERSQLFERWHDAMHATAGALLARTGARHDVADLVAAAHGIALAASGPDQAHRLLEYFRRGIRAAPGP
ncbi:TetR/AcrR family transcriptional regulator [Actinomadura rugatobispora]|uniref:TetR/AcrR family transcriptional regulator n=1 Tax=Actinomadura rugatobispora TaxID=1994 RepID=A0ABW0ZQK7_9ACTN|nr:TetR/AcrR family transcriptional regulator [Actinomadura rugatobispora]